MKITFYGHASIGIEVGGKHILVDPFISANPLAENVDINTIKADYILLTHAHGDHILDVELRSELRRSSFQMLRLLVIMRPKGFKLIL
jgi:L-ascorbate metabolism protein UlaG (beta-lactamase superfamily)